MIRVQALMGMPMRIHCCSMAMCSQLRWRISSAAHVRDIFTYMGTSDMLASGGRASCRLRSRFHQWSWGRQYVIRLMASGLDWIVRRGNGTFIVAVHIFWKLT